MIDLLVDLFRRARPMNLDPCRKCPRRDAPGGCPRALACVVVAGGALAPLAIGGCGPRDRPADASPIVAPDSEAGRRAIAEAEALLRLRQQEEARSRRRAVVAPEG